MKVIKRDGSTEDYSIDKIRVAIGKAYKDIDGANITDIELVTIDVDLFIRKNFKETIGIEAIQDQVEKSLVKRNLADVAKEYILYREKRRQDRALKAELYDSTQDAIKQILSLQGIENANANVDERSFSGKAQKVQEKIFKDYALNNLLDNDVADAHITGKAYTHDLSEYIKGTHNCLNIDFEDLFINNEGFATRNCDVRKPNDIMTFFQLVAVTFQIQSQVQFGGVGTGAIDHYASPYVAITFKKEFKEALIDMRDKSVEDAQLDIALLGKECRLGSEKLKTNYPKEYKSAERRTIKKTEQACESLFHNLGTLESRAGSQVPFSSINYGTDTSPEGRLVNKSLLNASIKGVGKHNRTSIFPISIWQWRKGINDRPGTPNYDLTLLAIKSLSKRIYPNIVNTSASYEYQGDDFRSFGCTMGCRTKLGRDRHGLEWERGGRGNCAPITMNLVDMAIDNGICQGKREKADIDGFFKDLQDRMQLCERALLKRYDFIANQKAVGGEFMHKNGTMKNTLGRKLAMDESVKENMKHQTLSIGYIGGAEACKAMFGETHTNNEEAYQFLYKVVETIYNYTLEASERNDLNFSCYATPAENTCKTLLNNLVARYGIIEGVTDREYISNSHHIPVYDEISIFKKIDKEAPFAKLCTAGYILYVELESSVMNNPKALEKIIQYAMSKDVYYLAFNFPIDTCIDCGFSAEINEDDCPVCHSTEIERLRRVTGYLTADYRKFNSGKIAEVKDRVKHSKFTKFE